MKARTYFVLLALVLAAPLLLLAKISAEHDNVGYDANYFTAVLGCCHCKGACPLGAGNCGNPHITIYTPRRALTTTGK